jgi:hypothetical protein
MGKTFSLLALLSATGTAVQAQATASIQAALVVEGRSIALTPAQESTFTALAIEGLRSSSYEADTSIATSALWVTAAGEAHLRLTFTPARPVAFRFSSAGPARMQTLLLQELLFPVTRGRAPDYILVRSEQRVRAFAKFGSPVMQLEKALSRFTP